MWKHMDDLINKSCDESSLELIEFIPRIIEGNSNEEYDFFNNGNLTDNYIQLVLDVYDKDLLSNEDLKDMIGSYFKKIGIFDSYHEPEIDTKVNNSIEVNIKGFYRSLNIGKKYHDLAIEEKAKIIKETPESIKDLKSIVNQDPDFNLKYNGLDIKQLDKLFNNIIDANKKLIQISKVLDLDKSLKLIQPTNIKKLYSKAEKVDQTLIKNELIKTNSGFEKYIKSNMKTFPYVGMGNFTYSDKTKMAHYTGIHPKYKIGFLDSNHTLTLSKVQSQLIKQFDLKKKLIQYLDWVIESLRPLEKSARVAESLKSPLLKLKLSDSKLFYVDMVGFSIIRNWSRLYAAVMYKVTKGSKYISRKTRLIQTKLKRVHI